MSSQHSQPGHCQQPRYLVVIADDFGIGPGTSEGILRLSQRGLVTGSVLLVNSPHAEAAVRAWKQAGARLELGWHPCLTLDRPISPPGNVPSLIQKDGTFWPLGAFLKKLFFGRISAAQVEAELRAQLRRFRELVGRPPTLVNAHHHVNVFHPIDCILLGMLRSIRPLPFLRRVREPWSLLWRVPGARKKRMLLNLLGRRLSGWQAALGFPGADCLIGITDPRWIGDPRFLVRWLERTPGPTVELTCHPGLADDTLAGRDTEDGLMQRRVAEYALLEHASFPETCRRLGFKLVSTRELQLQSRVSHAA